MKALSVLILSLLLVSACGFHLRGSQPGTTTTVSRVFLSDSTAPAIGTEIRSQMESAGTVFSGPGVDTDYTLYLGDQSARRTILSVSATTGKVEEYQLTISVRMTVTDAAKKELLSNQLISVRRDYTFDDNAVLGSVTQERVIEAELMREAASQVIRRFNAVTR